MGYRDAWFGVQAPPQDKCSKCGAVRREDVIDMVPRPGGKRDDYVDTNYIKIKEHDQ